MRIASRLPAVLAISSLCSLATAQSTQDQTGLTALIQRLGLGAQPTGNGVTFGQVEAPVSGAYSPDPNHPEFAGKTITLKSGASSGPSSHATVVGLFGYGSLTSIAPGVATIDAYEANNWLGAGFINGSGATLPKIVTDKIFNNSWIGSAGGASNLYLRKLDYAINTQGLIVVSGVNNGAGSLDVPLLSHCFNGIAVGRSDGQHKSGNTGLSIDGPGRMKPELVAPAPATSFATPLVAGAAALLVETARTHPNLAGNPHAELPDVIKAALMTGAEHRTGWSNGAPTSGLLRGATDQPLDPVWGADEIDVNHSHWILTAGEKPLQPDPATTVDVTPAGWAEVSIGSGESRWLRFQVEAQKSVVSVLATWNREIAPGFTGWSMPDLDLQLFGTDSQGSIVSLVGTPPGAYFGSGNVLSNSIDDNIEHLYIGKLEPGEYYLELRRTLDTLPTWQVALAWNFTCPDPVAYGTGKVSSIGTTPTIRTRGVPAVFANDFHLLISGGVPNKVGLVFYGGGAASLPFAGGTLLVQPPVVRLSVLQLDSVGSADLAIPLNFALVGVQRNYQYWFRDPQHPDGTGAGLTDAVEVHYCY